MFAVTGATGRVGGAMARALIAGGETVRAVIRDPAKAAGLAACGCEVALAEMDDPLALGAAFAGADGVFVVPPPVFDPAPGYPEARRVVAAAVTALRDAAPKKVVWLSTVGADAREDNLLSQHTLMEQALSQLALPLTILRPAWFLDNAAWDVSAARGEGVLRTFLQPAERAVPMVAAQDVGQCAGTLIGEDWRGTRVIGLEGPERVSPRDLAAAFERALSRPVRVEIVPRDEWEALFSAQGMRNPRPRARMLDGFNEGWIGFPGNVAEMRRGGTSADMVIAALVS